MRSQCVSPAFPSPLVIHLIHALQILLQHTEYRELRCLQAAIGIVTSWILVQSVMSSEESFLWHLARQQEKKQCLRLLSTKLPEV